MDLVSKYLFQMYTEYRRRTYRMPVSAPPAGTDRFEGHGDRPYEILVLKF
jgi:hypothetical protein